MAAATTLVVLLLFLGVAQPGRGAELPMPINDEVLGLVVFKSALSDPSGALATWAEADATPCGWAHVECDPATSRVLRLALDGLGLSGAMPRGLDRLETLQSLSLARNNLSGVLPPGLSLLRSLRSLDLSYNAFSGPIPDDVPLMSSLRLLDLTGNAFAGPLPSSLPPSLRFLMLAGNRFSGPLPKALSQCSILLHLNVSGNQLSGSPDFAAALWPLSRLRVLDMSRNEFSGPVANGIAMLHNLKLLDLSSNRFFGAVPAGIGLCPHLSSIDISSNAFDGGLPNSMRLLGSLVYLSAWGNRLSGNVPEWLGKLSALQHLDLSDNQLAGGLPDSLGALKDMSYLSLSNNRLTGAIPDSIGKCAKLAELHLGGNALNGSIPRALFDLGLEVLDMSGNELSGAMPSAGPAPRLAGTLQWLDLSGNRMTGTIPAEMPLFSNLQYLNLSRNDLRSPLPRDLGLLRNLSMLDLRSTTLFGPIPSDLCKSGSLAVLQLDGNALTGPIPDEIGNCSSLYLLSLAHNGLTGPIPAGVAALRRLEILRLEYNNLTGEIPLQLGGLESLLAVNISHNRLVGRLPASGVFQSLDASALEGNLGICSPLLDEPCRMNVPKPLVLDPNEYPHGGGDNNLVTGDTSRPAVARRRRFLSVSALVAISAALVIVLGVLVVSLLNASARRRTVPPENAPEMSMFSSSTRSSGGPAVGKVVTFGPRSSLRSEDLVGGAETLLSKASELGQGVFGTVYKASVGEGRVIAVKKLVTANIIQYHDDFDREVRILGKAKHPNLMPLKGYYWTPQMQLLMSDYAPHGSLEARLHGNVGASPPLTWTQRFGIVVGTARGLEYLHQSFRRPIIHYNIKPSNILLDEHCNPKISDFGLARLLPKLDKHIMSSRFKGAMGYVAPELACQSLRINEKCDIYGFGVLILELVTGRKAVEYGDDDVVILIDQVRVLLEHGNVLDCVDPSIGEFPEEEVMPVLKLGMVCTSQIPSNRPSMAEVVQILQVIRTPVVERMEAF